jgi:HSP20 family molecular chaperone IbpA
MEGDTASKEHRLMVEEITVTPFFKRHRSHMPATIKLHAEMKEEKDRITLTTDLRGYTEEDVEVSATLNTIHIDLILERKETGHLKVHNSYATPWPIDSDKITKEHKGHTLKITAHRR